MADGAIGGFLQAFTAVSQQRFENQLALRRQQQEETQFNRQMQLTQMKLDYDKQLNEQDMARQTFQAARQEKQQGFENKLAIKGMQLKEKGQMAEVAHMKEQEQRIQERNRLDLQVKGMQAYGKLRGEYDKKVAEAMDLERKRGIAAGLGEPMPELDYQYQRSLQDLMGMRSDMSRLEQSMQSGMEAPTEEMPVTEQGTPQPGEAEPAEIPGGGEETPAEPTETPAAPMEGVSPAQQAPEAYPGARFMGGRPQPATKAEADEIEADINARYKAIDKPGNVQIQSLPEKLEGQENQLVDLARNADALNAHFRLNPNTAGMKLLPATDEDGKPTGALSIYDGQKPLDPHSPELDKNGFAKRTDMAKVIERFAKDSPTVQPGLGRVYDAYVVKPITEAALAISTPKDGEQVVEINQFDLLKKETGRNQVIAMLANEKATWMFQQYGIVPSPLPPKVEHQEMNAGEVLDRVEDEIFGGGGAPPSATLAVMDQLLQPDQPDGQFSPAAMQKIQDLVNKAIGQVDELRLRAESAGPSPRGAALGMTGGGQESQKQLQMGQNVLRALQNTQFKMRNFTRPEQGVIKTEGLASPELRQFGGLIQQGMGIQEAVKKTKPGKAGAMGASRGGISPKAGMITMAAMALPGQAPAPKPEQKQPPTPEPSQFNKAMGSIGANTKDKNVIAQTAIGTVKDDYGKMDKAQQATAQKAWQSTRVRWQNLGVRPDILKDMNVAVGLPRDEGIEKEKPKKKEEPTAKDKAKGMTPLTPQQKAEKERKEALDKRRKEVLEKQKKKAG